MSTVVCTSDLHGYGPEVPHCDLLVIAGDLTHGFTMTPDDQIDYLRSSFSNWLDDMPANEVALVAGNHDLGIQKYGWPGSVEYGVNYLQDEGFTTATGLKVWGTPWQPWFYSWAFNAPRERGEEFLKDKFDKIPDDTDIIICHGPPLGYGDGGQNPGQPGKGSIALTETIMRVKPKLVVVGHIHPGYGEYQLGDTTIINAALVDDEYQPVNEPILIELPDTN